MKLLSLLGVMAAAVGGIVIYDTNRFVVRRYTLSSAKIEKEYRLVMLSDLHGKNFGKNNEKLLSAIQKLEPDGIYIAGDMITAKPGKDFLKAAKFIRRLGEEYPVYYGSGNHEYRIEIYPKKYKGMSRKFERAVRGPGIYRLKNNKTFLEDKNIEVYGLEIDREFYKKVHAPSMNGAYLENKLGKPDGKRFNILIAHNPSYFPAYAQFGADLVLSGHVHGGIARIPFLGGVISPAFRLFPKYDGGSFKEKDSVMILGRGLGTHTLPIRFLNPGELVEVTILPEHR